MLHVLYGTTESKLLLKNLDSHWAEQLALLHVSIYHLISMISVSVMVKRNRGMLSCRRTEDAETKLMIYTKLQRERLLFLLSSEGLLQNNNRLMHKRTSKSTTAWPINLQGRGIFSSVPPARNTLLESLTYIWLAHTQTNWHNKCWPRRRCPLRDTPSEKARDTGSQICRYILIHNE